MGDGDGGTLDVATETVAETENYVAWTSDEPGGELVVHVELGPVTLHFFRDEWEELVELVDAAKTHPSLKPKRKR